MKKRFINRINYNSLAIISGNMAKLYSEGIPFVNTLKLIEELPVSKDYIVSIKKIRSLIEEGNTLYDSFNSQKQLYPQFFLAMLDIGEKTGEIEAILKGLENFYGKLNIVKKKVGSALIYPSTIFIAFTFMVIFGVFVALPSFGDIYISMGKEMPDICKRIIELKKFIIGNKFLAMSRFICWGIIVPYIILGKIIRKPIWSAISKIKIIIFFNEYISVVLLSVIFNSGISISKGLEVCTDVGISRVIKEKFQGINSKILNGNTLSEAAKESNVFSSYTLAHIKLGEESGNLDARFMLLEKELYKNIMAKINKNVEMIQPIIIIAIGIVIVSFILMFILPLFDSLLMG